MNKSNFRKAIVGLIATLGFLAIAGCGGGRGGDSSSGIRPTSLNGVSFEFEGARLTFSSPAPNSSATGTENGGIVYERIDDDDYIFLPEAGAGDSKTFRWPSDIGGTTRYEYTPIDGRSGQLLIYSENGEFNTILNGTDGDFDTFTITFNASGSRIPNATVIISVEDDLFTLDRYARQEVVSLDLGSGDVPIRWNGVNTGAGFIADPSLDGKLLSLTEDFTDTGFLFTFTATSTNSSARTETGAVTVSKTVLGSPNVVSTYSGTYSLTQPNGTEDVVITLDYTGGTPVVPPDEITTLTFTGGESLTVFDIDGDFVDDIDVRTGTYSSTSGSVGIFILDRDPL